MKCEDKNNVIFTFDLQNLKMKDETHVNGW